MVWVCDCSLDNLYLTLSRISIEVYFIDENLSNESSSNINCNHSDGLQVSDEILSCFRWYVNTRITCYVMLGVTVICQWQFNSSVINEVCYVLDIWVFVTKQ